ncbi:hypothetical protein LXL04_015946 [Taraxacum kok-saghyz]
MTSLHESHIHIQIEYQRSKCSLFAAITSYLHHKIQTTIFCSCCYYDAVVQCYVTDATSAAIEALGFFDQNMDQYFEVDSFRSLCCGQRWFNFTCARVICVWRDYARNRLIIMFVDKNRKNDGCCSDIVNARWISRENTKVLVKSVKEFTNEGVYTSNVTKPLTENMWSMQHYAYT